MLRASSGIGGSTQNFTPSRSCGGYSAARHGAADLREVVESRATACPALVYVDGTLRARLGAAQSATIPVRAGYLNVRVKLGKFCGTIRDRIISLSAAPKADYRYLIGIADVPEN